MWSNGELQKKKAFSDSFIGRYFLGITEMLSALEAKKSRSNESKK
jgi:hypothetical protein